MSLIEQIKHPVDEIYEFVKPYFPGFDSAEVHATIVRHWTFGTIDAVYRGDKIIACVRWNMSESGKVFDILDLFITPGEKGLRIMKHLIARNWHRYPEARFIRFARTRKYPGRTERIYSIRRILQLKEKTYVR